METDELILFLTEEEDQPGDPANNIAQTGCDIGLHTHGGGTKSAGSRRATHGCAIRLLIATILLLTVGRRLLITTLLIATLLSAIRIIWIWRRSIATVLALLIRVLALIRIPTHDFILP